MRNWILLLSVVFLVMSSFDGSHTRSGAEGKDIIYRNYVQLYAHLAQKEFEAYGVPASVTLAQALVETDGGRSILARRARNHFGIKCKKSWIGSSYFYKDDERNTHGAIIPSCFRAYDEVEQSYRDHSRFLAERERYRSLFELDSRDYKGWCRGLKSCGYATSASYAEKLIETIEAFDLQQYDRY